jgi:hypothetical protein
MEQKCLVCRHEVYGERPIHGECEIEENERIFQRTRRGMWIGGEFVANAACDKCGRTDLLLHHDHTCTDCHKEERWDQ